MTLKEMTSKNSDFDTSITTVKFGFDEIGKFDIYFEILKFFSGTVDYPHS